MACNLNISKSINGCWAVISTSGLIYHDDIFVKVKDHGIDLGTWTLNEIIEGFKKSLKGDHNDLYSAARDDIPHLINRITKLETQMQEKISDSKSIWKSLSQLDSRINGQVVQIVSLEHDQKYTREKISFHHSELVKLNALMAQSKKKYESHRHRDITGWTSTFPESDESTKDPK